MEAVEISPKSGVTVQTLSERIVEHGGAALIIDYGYQDGDNPSDGVRDTFRAFKRHELHDPLNEPGCADLTADVDFGYLKRHCEKFDVLTYGPVSQNKFLTQLGIQVRCNLLKDANPKLADDLERGLQMLISPDKMGTRFKFFSVFPKTMSEIHAEFPPAGFKMHSQTKQS